jgi:hypothetical protein
MRFAGVPIPTWNPAICNEILQLRKQLCAAKQRESPYSQVSRRLINGL